MFKKFFAWKSKHLDERQLIIRGNLFGRALVVSVVSMIVLYFLHGANILYIEAPLGYLTGMVVTLTVFLIDLIRNEVYPMGEKRHRILYTIFGLYGAGITAFGIWCAKNGEALVEGKTLMATGLLIFWGVLFMLVPIAYFIRAAKSKKSVEEEEE